MIKFFKIFLSIILFASCSSLKQPSSVFKRPDYTEKDIIENEKKRISSIASELPVKALWQAELLGDSGVIDSYKDNLFKLLKEAVDKKNFHAAIRYYLSLNASGFTEIKNLQITENELFEKYTKDVPGFSALDSILPKNISDCINATVTIWIDKGIKFQNGAGYADHVIGSGFFIDKRGYIVTNYHVIKDIVDPKYEGYSRLFIKLAQNSHLRIPATVTGYDPLLDLALIKAEIIPSFVLALGSSSDLTVGDKISAIGTPLGLHGTLTAGIVSAVNRKLFTSGGVLQIDAAVNSGNSGGPCIDDKMRVQAVVFAGILQFQGLNFAIPVEYLRQTLPYLYKGGKRVHVWLGAYGNTLKDANKNSGVEIKYVMPGGIADRAGLEAGDVIVFIGGKDVFTLEDMQDILRNYITETIIECRYVRNGILNTKLLYLEERPEYPGYEIYKSDLLSRSFIPIFGMELKPSSTISSRKYIISEIIPGSIADESGFSVTDPVYISSVEFDEEKSAISVQMHTRKKKKGYLDVSIRIGSMLDSPYYF